MSEKTADALRRWADEVESLDTVDFAIVGELMRLAADQLEQTESRLSSALLERDEARRLLNEVDPIETCARCGKEFRSHEMTWEEGDERECLPCNDRENARERAELHDNNALATSANPDDDVQEFAVERQK